MLMHYSLRQLEVSASVECSCFDQLEPLFYSKTKRVVLVDYILAGQIGASYERHNYLRNQLSLCWQASEEALFQVFLLYNVSTEKKEPSL